MLNQLVVQSLVDHGVPAVSLSPCGAWTTDKGVVTEDGTASICRILNGGFIPCLHGDCVLDKTMGCKILSGDVIIKRLCEVLSPGRVVFMTDVPGIYTHPPLQPDADFIPCIRISGDDGTMDIKLDTAVTTAHDVTGGIRLKLDCAVEIVLKHRGTIPVIICSCTDGAYENICLSGKLNGKLGTIVEYIDENI